VSDEDVDKKRQELLKLIGSDINGPNSIQNDPKSQREAELLDNGYEDETDKDLKEQNKNHTYNIREAFHKIFVFALRIAGFTLIILFLIRVWHLATPTDWQWLDENALKNLDQIFLSGAIGGILAKHLDTMLGQDGTK